MSAFEDVVEAWGFRIAGDKPAVLSPAGIAPDGSIVYSDAESFRDLIGAEPELGNPSVNGWILSSSSAGVRSWVAPNAHSHAIADVTGLQAALNAKLSTVTADAASRAANTVYAAPNGSAGSATFRTLVAADIPAHDTSKLTSGTLGVSRGGTGISAPGSTAGNLRWNGSAYTLDTASYALSSAIPAASSTIPSALGTAAVGTGATWARADHVHAMPTAAQVGAAASAHTHAVADVTGLQTALDARSLTSHNHTLDSLSNTTITSIATGEILKWSGAAWVNNTLAEAGIQPAGSYLTGNQTITLSGVVTGSGATAITTSIADAALSIAKTSGLQSALDAKMATASYPDLVSIEALAGTSGLLRKTAANTWSLDTASYALSSAIPVASSTTPAALGTAAVGTGTTWARADHVHALPTAAQVGAAAASHNHDIADVTGLQTALDSKVSIVLSRVTQGTYVSGSGDAASLATRHANGVHFGRWYNIAEAPKTGYFNFLMLPETKTGNTHNTLAFSNTDAIEGYIGRGNTSSSETWRRIWTDGDFSATDIAAWNAAYDHSQATGNPHVTTYSQLASIPAALDAIDGLTPAADRIAYYTGANSAALAPLSAFGRSLIDDANAATARTTLGAAASAHTHAIADVTGLQTALDARSLTSHNHTLNSLSNVTITSIATGELLRWNGTAWANATLAEAGIQPAGSYASSSHNHAITDVAGLQTALDGAVIKSPATSQYVARAIEIQGGIRATGSLFSGHVGPAAELGWLGGSIGARVLGCDRTTGLRTGLMLDGNPVSIALDGVNAVSVTSVGIYATSLSPASTQPVVSSSTGLLQNQDAATFRNTIDAAYSPAVNTGFSFEGGDPFSSRGSLDGRGGVRTIAGAGPFGAGVWYNVVDCRHRNTWESGDVWGGELAWGMTAHQDRMAFRSRDASGNPTAWTDVWTSANLINPTTGTGVSGRVAYWSGVSSQSSSANLTFDGSHLYVGGGVSADTIYARSTSTSGQNIRVGNASWIGDIGITNTLNIRGTSSGNVGYIRFGSDYYGLGYNGSTLVYNNSPVLTAASNIAFPSSSRLDISVTGVTLPDAPLGTMVIAFNTSTTDRRIYSSSGTLIINQDILGNTYEQTNILVNRGGWLLVRVTSTRWVAVGAA